MNITSINSNSFAYTRMNIRQSDNYILRMPATLSFASSDRFEKQSFDIADHLNEIQLKDEINEGIDAVVYKTNYDGYVVRVLKDKEFKPQNLEMLHNTNTIILASDKDDTEQLMKFVKGEPLYSKGWKFNIPMNKDEYMKHFDMIMNLPDKTFSDYISDVINIRKNGYNIDSINPNNFLLDGEHINIVDLEKSDIKPVIKLSDFSPLINLEHISKILETMSHDEIDVFSDKIKIFYDRMITLSKQQNQDVKMPEIDNTRLQSIEEYLYHKHWDMLEFYSGTPVSAKIMGNTISRGFFRIF